MNRFIKNVFPALIVGLSAPAYALDSQWYIGLGGGSSFLKPTPLDDSVSSAADSPVYSTVFLGRDIDRILSIQLQAGALGDAELSNGGLVSYSTADASIIYRLYDSRDMNLTPDGFGISVYGKASFGAIGREISGGVALENESTFYFGGGLGAEIYLWGPMALRMEAVFVDSDVKYGSISLVTRFGGYRAAPVTPVGGGNDGYTPPADIPAQMPGELPTDIYPETPPSAPPLSTPVPDNTQPTYAESDLSTGQGADTDGDGIADAIDSCIASAPGYPVNDNGCPLLNGVLTGVSFAAGTATMDSSSFQQLDYLAELLSRHPQARVQLRAHTDTSTGAPRDQAILTRSRLRALGTYLVRQGISANRLVLRSLGGSQPAYDNATIEGRAGNNRIEVLEQL